ncbi:MAG: pyrroline-5-carboxylate reductase [Saprospiraceae bacterium]|nr:pyrroline-5-carboxylate reductase [Saprospiraceae bacterium]
MKILIIGGGNMGRTYARSFLRGHVASPEQLFILEKSPDRAEVLAKENVGTVFDNPEDCMPAADLIILAVKPQDSKILFPQIKPFIHPQQVLLSIMAGVKMESIATALGNRKVIRAMPNLPAQIGMGMTVFTSMDDVTRIELVLVQNLINTTGKTIYVEKEEAIDAATAISGSGPAYVWFFMNAMMEAARTMGFSTSEAELLVSQTFKGAVDLFHKSDYDCEEWIRRVCSRGGTTEAALASFDSTDLNQQIRQGAFAALSRAIELGK